MELATYGLLVRNRFVTCCFLSIRKNSLARSDYLAIVIPVIDLNAGSPASLPWGSSTPRWSLSQPFPPLAPPQSGLLWVFRRLRTWLWTFWVSWPWASSMPKRNDGSIFIIIDGIGRVLAVTPNNRGTNVLIWHRRRKCVPLPGTRMVSLTGPQLHTTTSLSLRTGSLQRHPRVQTRAARSIAV